MAYILYFIITIGVLVLVHEFGHFIAAKLFGMKVDTFSVGFPPRAFGKKIGETDYCVSWIPIGGYVKVAGMVDESLDTDFLKKPPEPNEFRSKPMYQRMIVVSAGVIMNFLLTFGVLYGIILGSGRTFYATTTVGSVVPNSAEARIGFQKGDDLLSVNNKTVKNWQEIEADLYLGNASSALAVKVKRNGEIATLTIPKGVIGPEKGIGINPAHMHEIIGDVQSGGPAAKAGLKAGDVILTINDQPVSADSQLISLVKQNKGKTINLGIRRNGKLEHFSVTPGSDGLIGIRFGLLYAGPLQKMKYNVLSAVPVGLRETTGYTALLIESLVRVATGKASFSKTFGGPIKIAQLATESAEMGFLVFLKFMALLSISLAVLNILPFPALDGGHLAFLIYESIFRREVPARIKIFAQQVGFAILLLFMAFIIYNDIVHF